MTAIEPLWDFEAVSNYLGVPVQTIKRWRQHGAGPVGYRVGKHVRYDPAEVRAWLRTQRDKAS